MRSVKSVAVGIVTAIVTSFGWVLLRLFIADLTFGRQVAEITRSGSGFGGAALATRVDVVTDVSILGSALIGFLVGFWWMSRKTSRRRHATS